MGLFWEGSFERALATVDGLLGSSSVAMPAPTALKIVTLIFAGRAPEARALFSVQPDNPRPDPDQRHAVPSRKALEAMLRFHEGDVASSRLVLEGVGGERRDPRAPVTLIARYYLAAIAQKDGRASDSRTYLAAVVRFGARFFIARWAQETHDELFPSQPLTVRAESWASGPASASRLRGVRRDLRVGLRLLAFRRYAIGTTPYSYEQAVVLLLANLVLIGFLGFTEYRPRAIFLELNAVESTAPVLFLVVGSYFAAKALGTRDAALQLCVRLYSALPTLLVLEWMSRRLDHQGHPISAVALHLVSAAWSLALVVFLARRLAPHARVVRVLAAAAVLGLTWSAPMYSFAHEPMWLESRAESFESRAESSADERDDLEDFIYSQADLLVAADAKVLASRPGVTDLYFVGVAGWDQQDVFFKETKFARALFDERFDTKGRSLILANDPGARGVPAASRANLRRALKAIGSRMDREEDILFLFMTSHGSEREFALRSAKFPMLLDEQGITPSELRVFLDDAGIKWRVLMVSACRSGAFVTSLRNDFTVIATAAASDRASFGCANGNDFTEYGRAVFVEQLTHESSFVTAFTEANKVVSEREVTRKLEPSEPQLFVGSAIGAKLDALKARLEAAAGDAGEARPSGD